MHRNARLTVWRREELVRRVHAGRPARTSRPRWASRERRRHKWLRRFDRRARPATRIGRRGRARRDARRRCRGADLRASTCAQIRPARIGWALAVAPSTVHHVSLTASHGWLDGRPTGRVIRRCGVIGPASSSLDIKKLGRLRTAAAGAHSDARRHAHGPRGYDYVHSAVDDHSRLAYSEILPDERGASCAGFLERAIRFYRDHNVIVERVLTDNAMASAMAPTSTASSMSTASAAGLIRPTGRRRTARSNATTEPCSTDGRTASRLSHQRHRTTHSPAGSTTTTHADPTTPQPQIARPAPSRADQQLTGH